MVCELGDICDYVHDKIEIALLDNNIYISTENMLPNRGGITSASSLPAMKRTRAFLAGDVLVSNIRLYFKKIWFAKFNGGCSNNVLVFRAKSNVSKRFLYYLLSDDKFFSYSSATSIGTTMPCGDKTAIMQYEVTLPPLDVQPKIAAILSPLDDKIDLNRRINANLEQQARAIFKERFLSHETLPDNWKILTLGDVADMTAGGDRPKIISSQKTQECPYPIYSNSASDEGLYGYTNGYRVNQESVTVSARGTIGFVCLRHVPYTPIVRLLTLIPHTEIISAKYLYMWLKNISIQGTGTTQQQLVVPDFRRTEIIIPTQEEMISFTDLVSPFFRRIWLNQDENNTLAQIRDSLLPKLISGQIIP